MKITEIDAKALLKHLCRDYSLPSVDLWFSVSINNRSYFGEYVFEHNRIQLFNADIDILLHEFAHHIHSHKLNKASKHNFEFYKICFELKDFIKSAYGINWLKITNNINSVSYQKACHKRLYKKEQKP